MNYPEHIKIRQNPRISANDLARYLVSTETGKLGIIKQSREVSTPVVVRYKMVKKVLIKALSNPIDEKRYLNEGINDFQKRAKNPNLSAFVRDDAARSVDVLTAFKRIRNTLAGHNFFIISGVQPSLVVEGVEISINCDLSIIDGEDCGALIFRFTKPEETESETAKTKREKMGCYVATLIKLHVAQHLSNGRNTMNRLCWSTDIQFGDNYVCPNNIKQRVNEIRSACKFIKAMW